MNTFVGYYQRSVYDSVRYRLYHVYGDNYVYEKGSDEVDITFDDPRTDKVNEFVLVTMTQQTPAGIKENGLLVAMKVTIIPSDEKNTFTQISEMYAGDIWYH
jgi:hypothetical protein